MRKNPISSRGGSYIAEPMLSLDHQESYLTTVLDFVGIYDITFIRAEGLNMGDKIRSEAIQQAEVKMNQIFEPQIT